MKENVFLVNYLACEWKKAVLKLITRMVTNRRHVSC